MILDDTETNYDLGVYYDSSSNLIATIAYAPDADRDHTARADLPADDTDVIWVRWSNNVNATVDTTKTQIFWRRSYSYVAPVGS